MFRRTIPCRLAMVSTHGGMRRILKRSAGGGDGILTYIRQAVESGTYRTTDEIDEMIRARASVSGLTGVDLNQPDFEQDDGSGIHDLKSVMHRFRQDIVRGSSVVDYPKEYLILRQHPPFPDPPRTPAKVLRRLQRQRHEQEQAEIKPLMQHYMNRQKQQARGNGNNDKKQKKKSDDYSSEDYYRRLLGVPAPPLTTILGQKTAAVQKAYAAAIVHYQLMRSSSAAAESQLSPAQVSQKVDELLQQAHEQQVETCQTVMEQVQQWKKQAQEQQQQQQQQDAQKETTQSKKTSAAQQQKTAATSTVSVSSSAAAAAAAASTTMTSSSSNNILGNDARKVHGMLRWSKRLQAVPYRQWTVGASTALDHWIARQVLKMEEDTWQSLLEGHDDDDYGDLIQLGRQVVAVREALFPETSIMLDESSSSSWQEDDDNDDEYTNKVKETDSGASGRASDKSQHYSVEKKIEELLASLGSMSSSYSKDIDKGDTTFFSTATSEAAEKDQHDKNNTASSNNALIDWTHKLQEWRRRCRDDTTPLFKDWSLEKKNEFRAFVREYASIAAAAAAAAAAQNQDGSSGGTTTMTARRSMSTILDKRDHEDDALLQVLLDHPPVNQPESSAFWDALQTKQEATKLLATLHATTRNGKEKDLPDANTTTNNNNAAAAAALALLEFFIGPPSMFLNDDMLNQSDQLDRLLNLGALRPLLDEYISEEERIDFWKRHGDAIFANVPLEHLIEVSDETGGSGNGSGSGIITGHDLQGTPLSRDLNLVLSPQSRFMLQTMPFRQDASSLLQAWNEHKASRARYEEELFQTGRLGLRYPKKEDRDKAEDDDDDDKRDGKKRQPWY